MGKEELIVRLIKIANNLKSQGEELEKDTQALAIAIHLVKGVSVLEEEVLKVIRMAIGLEDVLRSGCCERN